MSFNAKNLSYGAWVTSFLSDIRANTITDCEEPAFLRRLRGEIGGQDSSRHERAIARPRKLKKPTDDEDDEPTYVDEENHEVISKSGFEALANRERSDGTEHEGIAPSHAQPEERTRFPLESNSNGPPLKEHVASVGVSSKRKIPKVFGNEDIDFAKRAKADSPDNNNELKTRKGRKIKLSFDEDAGS